MSLSHSRVPAKLHESSFCGKCGWLLSCDYSLTHHSQTASHSSSLTPSSLVNHQADLVECLSPRNLSSLPDHDLTKVVNITNTTLTLEQHDTAVFAKLWRRHMRHWHYVT